VCTCPHLGQFKPGTACPFSPLCLLESCQLVKFAPRQTSMANATIPDTTQHCITRQIRHKPSNSILIKKKHPGGEYPPGDGESQFAEKRVSHFSQIMIYSSSSSVKNVQSHIFPTADKTNGWDKLTHHHSQSMSGFTFTQSRNSSGQ
jgi:hypothetical protein